MVTLLSLTRDFRFFWAAELDQIRRKEEPAGYSKHFFCLVFCKNTFCRACRFFVIENYSTGKAFLGKKALKKEGWKLKLRPFGGYQASASIHNVFKKRRFEAPASDKRCKITLQNWNSAWYSCIMNTLQCGDAFVFCPNTSVNTDCIRQNFQNLRWLEKTCQGFSPAYLISYLPWRLFFALCNTAPQFYDSMWRRCLVRQTVMYYLYNLILSS